MRRSREERVEQSSMGHDERIEASHLQRRASNKITGAQRIVEEYDMDVDEMLLLIVQ